VTSTERPEFELSAPIAHGSVGERLQAARESHGWTIEHVAKQLKLAPRQVSALESNDLSQLPSSTFVRGFTRNYARLLKLDIDDLLAHDDPRRPATPLRAVSGTMGELREEPHEKSRFLQWLIIPILLVGCLVAAVKWYEMTRSSSATSGATEVVKPKVEPTTEPPKSDAPPPAPATDTPAPQPGIGIGPVSLAPGAPTPSTPIAPVSAPIVASTVVTTPLATVAAAAQAPKNGTTLELAFSGKSWTEIRDASGVVLTSRLQQPGARLTVSGQPPFRLTVGNASSVTLTRDGIAIDLAGKAGGSDVAKFSLE
jgi:cytoskeleton protein RodZ